MKMKAFIRSWNYLEYKTEKADNPELETQTQAMSKPGGNHRHLPPLGSRALVNATRQSVIKHDRIEWQNRESKGKTRQVYFVYTNKGRSRKF